MFSRALSFLQKRSLFIKNKRKKCLNVKKMIINFKFLKNEITFRFYNINIERAKVVKGVNNYFAYMRLLFITLHALHTEME